MELSLGQRLKEVAFVFLKLGTIAFGGPAAHIAMMEEEIVEKRKWISRQHFLDLVGATSLIPGPNSTEMTMHCGHERAGVLGLFVAGTCFIVPAVIFTGLLAWFYVTYGDLESVKPFLYGIKPAVIALIAMALWKLGKKAVKNYWLALLGILALAATLFGINEVFAILGAGLIGLIAGMAKKFGGSAKAILPFLIPVTTGVATTAVTKLGIFLFFLKTGAVLFGSGYVLIAYLEGGLVDELQWLSRQELLDAVAIGQFTPGPVLSTATFIGWQLDGISGAVLATVGIFLPSFLFVWILNPIVPKLRKSALASGFLDAVNVAALGVMGAALITIGYFTLYDPETTMVNWRGIVIAVVCCAVFFGIKKANALWIVILGALMGYGLSFV